MIERATICPCSLRRDRREKKHNEQQTSGAAEQDEGIRSSRHTDVAGIAKDSRSQRHQPTDSPIRYRHGCQLQSSGALPYKAGVHFKIGVVIEEADETVFWLELLGDSGIVKPAKLAALMNEAT